MPLGAKSGAHFGSPIIMRTSRPPLAATMPNEIIFAVVLTTLGVSDEDILAARLTQHLACHMPRMRAVRFGMKVLACDCDAGVLQALRDDGDAQRGRSDGDVNCGLSGEGSLEIGCKPVRFKWTLVHLPVAGDEWASCHGSLFDACFRRGAP